MSEQENVTIESLSVESTGPAKGGAGLENGLASAHTIDHGQVHLATVLYDSWGQLGLLLVTSFNCGYILSFSNLMLVPLGWTWGREMYYLTWVLQFTILLLGNMGFLLLGGRALKFTILLLGNMGFLLLGGRALKEINSEFSDSPLRLQIYILITGATYFVFAFLVPTVSSVRRWLGISVVLTFTYIVILLVIVVRDGRSNKDQNYDIYGSNFSKVMNGFGAISGSNHANFKLFTNE
ncbi:amino acid transporter, transmembrane domain-containing protein [Artemisia annua]|uniref:Amino acid transporter, transmembrane domain-containing protein n=1 Tax=Artemisia annua TaxID=35608 RepID=A0A2U1KQU3_ARTAN|nr:amino acid transporter, transmembrane domain-containing protein [Artemisia annua]